MRIRWTERARAELLKVLGSVAEDNPAAARGLLSRIRKAVNRLARFLNSGRSVSEFDIQSIRECIVVPYRIIHHVGREVTILSVYHSKRLLAEQPDVPAPNL